MNVSNNYNNMNININNSNNNDFINNCSLNSCCCPSCGEPAGNNFKGSGKDYESFICLKCGKHQSVANYYKCKICNGIFCNKCPQLNDRILASCPSFRELAGKNFLGSGDNTECFDCLKCGKHQSIKSYYKCKICKGIFCTNCPFNNNRDRNNYINKIYSCPACGEPSGKNFCGSGDKTECFDCLKCGKHQSIKSYYKCKICNGIFCNKCPFNNNILKNYFNNYNSNNCASCPACGEPSGNNFCGSGDETE